MKKIFNSLCLDEHKRYQLFKNGICVDSDELFTAHWGWTVIEEGIFKFESSDSVMFEFREEYVPYEISFKSSIMIDSDSELLYDSIIDSYNSNNKFQVKSILITKEKMVVQYVDSSLLLVVEGNLELYEDVKDEKNITKCAYKEQILKYDDGLDIDQQSQAYWEDLGIF
ncbi:MAG: hypothetical protein E7097_08520 [Bacteroides sp.]|nr:hypothetical protein [Bacteroides sp.]